MGDIPGEWLFGVWVCIVIVMLFVNGVRDYRARRYMPKNPGDRRTNRRIALENLKFLLGIKGKNNGDNPMNRQGGDEGTFSK
ncbi:MAG TPA: hypothetical protein DEO60_09560 [Bacteroidales bacterium]|nr:hypothetical protein [Bacteroidales bacterium]